MKKKIAIGADHGGFAKKEELKKILLEKGYEVKDFGVDSPASMDYPDVAHPLAAAVANGEYPRGNSPLRNRTRSLIHSQQAQRRTRGTVLEQGKLQL